MLGGQLVTQRHFLIAHQAYRDAAAVIAVIRLGHHWKTYALRGAHRLALALREFLLGHGQPERRQYLVGLLFVAGEFHRDVRCAAGHGCLDALLELSVAKLYQGLVVKPQPRYALVIRGAYQRRGRGSERTVLGEADELIAGLVPTPVGGHRVCRAYVCRQQRTEQSQAELAGGDALVALRILVHDRVDGPALRVLPNVTSSPAMFCSSMATCSSTCPSQVPSPSRMRLKKPPVSRYEQPCSARPGSAAASASTNPLPSFPVGQLSRAPRSSSSRMTGKRAYRDGPT